MVKSLEELPPIKDVLKKYNLRAKKHLGQNFLLDLNLTRRIARAAGDLHDVDVVEIGPGPGGLTRALLNEGARKIIAIERDERCIDALNDIAKAADGRLHIVAEDALKVDLSSFSQNKIKIIANLPYNVSTRLLLRWLRQTNTIISMTCMFQKEVADRLIAKVGTKSYGRLSVICQWLCHIRTEFDVTPNAFTPPPKITSTVVTLTPRIEPLAPAEWDHLEIITRAAFGQRRKMLRSSIKELAINLESLGIDSTLRAENLKVETFCRIAESHRKGDNL